MRKRKTIACDSCGARFDHIPETCPMCGEIIWERMDPNLRRLIIQKMHSNKLYFAGITFVHFVFIILAFILCAFIYKNFYSLPAVYFGLFTPLLLLAVLYYKKVKTRRRRIVMYLHLGVFMLLTVIGLLSCWVGAGKCERYVAKAMASGLRTKQFNVLAEHATPETVEIFKSSGLRFKITDEDAPPNQSMPWLNVEPARVEFPFIISIKVESMIGNLCGSGGRGYFLCLFGLNIYLWDECHWIS